MDINIIEQTYIINDSTVYIPHWRSHVQSLTKKDLWNKEI